MPDTEYKLIVSCGPLGAAVSSLESAVRLALANGWVPLGGPELGEDRDEPVVVQAMTRDRNAK